MRRTKWSKENIIQRLQQWHASGVPVKSLWRQDQPLTSSAAVIFGSWRATLDAAGFQSVRQRWSRAQVIENLRECRRNRRAISPKLQSALKREFGSMAKAYAAAGVQPRRKSQPQREWTLAQTVAAIHDRHNSGGTLSATHREDPALYAAAKRLHGSWTAALSAAELTPTTIERLSASEVIARIRARQRTGSSLSNIQRYDPQLARSADERFGGWRKALLAAGVATTLPRHWHKRAVVEAIQTRQGRGESLSGTWREDKPLFRAAVTHFGGWANAMRAAGFEPIPRERWSKNRVLERLRVWAERYGGSNLREVDPNLSAAASRLFGSYHAALQAAGLEPPTRYWTQARVVAAIQDRYIARSPLNIEGLGDLRLALAAKRRFGSWQAAVEAAGLADKISIKKPLRRWTPQEVLTEIRDWHQSGQPVTTISKRNQPLYNAAKTHFGSWGAALSAAGFQPSRRSWSKQTVLDEIHARVRRGESLSSGHPSNFNLAAVAYRLFGSWRKALRAAGVHTKPAYNKGA